MTLGMRIKQLRQERELSQPALSEMMGIEQSYLSKLENDKSLPSKEIFQALLDAFSLTPAGFLSQLDVTGQHARLMQIPQVREWADNGARLQASKMRQYLYTCTCLLVIGVTVFYAGISEKLFPATAYEYSSDGVVLPGEPENIFHSWLTTVSGREEVQAKRMEMLNREDEMFVTTYTYRGVRFKQPVEGGHRLFQLKSDFHRPRVENGWLEAIGLLCFLAGLAGLLLEKRLNSTKAG